MTEDCLFADLNIDPAMAGCQSYEATDPILPGSRRSWRRDAMATVMLMHWPEVTREKYDEVRRTVNWEGDTPKGARLHVAWFGDDGFRVLDLWDSREEFETFVQERLTPGVQQAGVVGQPRVEFAPAHAIFAPNP